MAVESTWERAQREAKGAAEHFAKYDALARKLGIQALKIRIRVGKKELQEALAKDPNLNNITLATWDAWAGRVPFNERGVRDFKCTWDPPFTRAMAGPMSLAERVCVLKHVATYYIAGNEKEE